MECAVAVYALKMPQLIVQLRYLIIHVVRKVLKLLFDQAAVVSISPR